MKLDRRRISPKELAALGWRRVDNGIMRTFQHLDGWLLEHCGHPTANYPYLLLNPDGERILTGALSGEPHLGHAWPTVAAAADYVASLLPLTAMYPQAVLLNDPCAGTMHRITPAGAVAPYRWRCVVCERQFLTAPNSIRVDELAARAPAPALQPAQAPAAAVESVLPPEKRFVAVKSAVMQGSEHIATAKSKTMAKRIANALNKHKPNDEGV